MNSDDLMDMMVGMARCQAEMARGEEIEWRMSWQEAQKQDMEAQRARARELLQRLAAQCPLNATELLELRDLLGLDSSDYPGGAV